MITGVFVLIDGIVALVAALSRGAENRGLAALIGVLNLVVGVLLIRHPIGGVVAVALLVGIWLIVAGAVRFVLAFDAAAASGLAVPRSLPVEIVAGIAIVSSPNIGVATLALLVGVALIANGVSFGALGFALHGAGRDEPAPAPHAPAAAVVTPICLRAAGSECGRAPGRPRHDVPFRIRGRGRRGSGGIERPPDRCSRGSIADDVAVSDHSLTRVAGSATESGEFHGWAAGAIVRVRAD